MCKISVHGNDVFTPFIKQYQRHAYTAQSIAINEINDEVIRYKKKIKKWRRRRTRWKKNCAISSILKNEFYGIWPFAFPHMSAKILTHSQTPREGERQNRHKHTCTWDQLINFNRVTVCGKTRIAHHSAPWSYHTCCCCFNLKQKKTPSSCS